jgi:hypothetical protein
MNIMEAQKTLDVYNRVKKLSKEGRLLWKEEADGNTFYTSIADFKIYIGKSAGTVSFELFNNLNTKIGIIEYGGYSPDVEGLDSFYLFVRKLITKTEDGLDDLLDQLDKID